MYDLMIKGGPVMWPLLACSVVALAVAAERILFWIMVSIRKDQKLVNRIFTLTERGDFDAAIAEGEASSCLVCRILTSGLAHRNYGLVQSLEAAAMHEIEKMKRYLSVLDTIITLAPLLGILGTVSGIIVSFDLLGTAGIENPKAVTGGIAQALLTTAAGLAIAIVALLPYNALTRKVEKVTRYLEQLITCYEVTVQKGTEAIGNRQ
ncbi:MAG: MotA/TolQ/ExbB proton channel family protein [Pontiellaceae bacterium]|nr:MotA/TolQ/ExbB proton channel family protein [Pontiellaceae bacterium]MBN2784781.1 MotA/TolQ/ExbB proton channel family protein [Pontiellaceae bacterium]